MKKIIMTFAALAVCSSVYAGDVNTKTYLGNAYLEDIVTDTNTYTAYATEFTHSYARIKVTLNGCMDDFGPITVNTSHDNEKELTNIWVTVVGILNPKSKFVKCVRAQEKTIEVFLGAGIYTNGNVKVMPNTFDFNEH